MVLLRYVVQGRILAEKTMDLVGGKVHVPTIKDAFNVKAVELNGILAAADKRGLTFQTYVDEEVLIVTGRSVLAAPLDGPAPAKDERPGGMVLLRYVVQGRIIAEKTLDLVGGKVHVPTIKDAFNIIAVELNGILAAADKRGLTFQTYADKEVLIVTGRSTVAGGPGPAPAEDARPDGCSSSSRRSTGEDSIPIVFAEDQGTVPSSGGVSNWDPLGFLLWWYTPHSPTSADKKQLERRHHKAE